MVKNINWEYVSLSHFGTIARGKSKHRPRNDAVLYGGKYPFIQTSDIKHANFYVNSYSQTYNEVGLAQSKLWPKDTLCMTIAANIAETALLSFPACFPDSVVGFVSDNKKSDVKFVKYALDNSKREFQKTAKGTAQDNLSLEKIDTLKIKAPDVETQSRIASVLSTYDDLIENNEKRIRILEEMAQRLYTEWFVKFKFPVYEKVRMVNSGTEFGKIPEGWEVKRIGDFAIVNMGQSPESKYYNTKCEGFPFHQGVADFGNKYPIDRVYSTAGNKYAQKHDLLFSVRAPVGRMNIANKKFILGRGLCGIRHKDSLQSLLYLMFINKFTEKDMIGNGAIYKSVNKIEIENIEFLCGTEELEKSFEKVIGNYFYQVEIITTANKILQDTRDLLIPQLVTGKKEVQ
ncbi:MAG: restriction endonuclease subunit S [Candidatus Firestonebacteria bacterium]